MIFPLVDELPDILQKQQVTIENKFECARKSEYYFPETQICAKSIHGSRNSGFCNGDSGGPLVCTTEDNEQYQFGIVSYTDCTLNNHPGYYTYVPAYHKWIINTIKGEFFKVVKFYWV